MVKEECSIAHGLLLYVPPGQKVEIKCPVHGVHIIRGRDLGKLDKPEFIKVFDTTKNKYEFYPYDN